MLRWAERRAWRTREIERVYYVTASHEGKPSLPPPSHRRHASVYTQSRSAVLRMMTQHLSSVGVSPGGADDVAGFCKNGADEAYFPSEKYNAMNDN